MINTGLDACLMRPNITIIGQLAWTKVRTHPDIVKAVHGHHALRVPLMLASHPEEALYKLEMALRLSPMEPHRWATKVCCESKCKH